MQTLYYTTSNFVRHTDNIVDLSEYRRKLAAVQRQQIAWQEDEEETMEYQPRPRRSQQRRERHAALLDLWASMGILVMTISFSLYVLCL